MYIPLPIYIYCKVMVMVIIVKHIDGELVFLSHDNLNFLAEQHNTSTLESPNPKYEDVGNGDVDGTDIFLGTYNQKLQRPPQVSTGGVVKHVTKQSSDSEICFRMLRPPHTCNDPTCKRLHSKEKINEVVTKNLKSLMTSNLNLLEDESP